ncbi:MAG: hypothetical protein EZS28_029362 [Streblomastix strix]|uniref:Uncharacterized protein n=1 Tax=Streblomastix strix TaxID=222440 RepID=A0A5J4UY42_9EUKA|nr:MAG: hypothetical protein EZS28_029362 [Streblomastix strix]
MKAISEVLAPQTTVLYVEPVYFSVSIPLNDLLFFSAYSEYPNSLFGNLKSNSKINPNPVTVSVRNYIIEAVTANMCGYKASESCLNSVRQFYSNHPFVVPAQRIQTLAFTSGAALTGLKPSQNIQLSHVTEM